MRQFDILTTEPSADYELLDSGEGEKLERFGQFILSRPDPQALWHKNLSHEAWKKVDGHFATNEKGGNWSLGKNLLPKWQIKLSGLKFWIKPTTFKHVGIFPEQSPNWTWLNSIISSAGTGHREMSELVSSPTVDAVGTREKIEILNLFAYTGGATLACAQAGAKVIHVDGSKVAMTWARENAELSGLDKKPIRWILDDARTFVKREIKRGRKYNGIIMDPPAFGHGPDNQIWKIEGDLLPLIEDCVQLLDDKPLFFLINGYAAGYSALAYENALLPMIKKFGGRIEVGELVVRESGTENQESRSLPCGIFARWIN